MITTFYVPLWCKGLAGCLVPETNLQTSWSMRNKAKWNTNLTDLFADFASWLLFNNVHISGFQATFFSPLWMPPSNSSGRTTLSNSQNTLARHGKGSWFFMYPQFFCVVDAASCWEEPTWLGLFILFVCFSRNKEVWVKSSFWLVLRVSAYANHWQCYCKLINQLLWHCARDKVKLHTELEWANVIQLFLFSLGRRGRKFSSQFLFMWMTIFFGRDTLGWIYTYLLY